MFLTLLNNNEKKDFLNLVLNIANIDGDFTETEKAQIVSYANEMGITLDNKDNYNKSNEELLSLFAKSNKNTQKAIFIESLALMLVDGMKEEEQELLKQMQSIFNLDNNFVEKATKWYQTISPLYKEGFKLIGIGE